MLLADEPTAALDSHRTLDVLDTIHEVEDGTLTRQPVQSAAPPAREAHP